MIITSNKISSYSTCLIDFIQNRNIQDVPHLSNYCGYCEEFNQAEHISYVKLEMRGDLPRLIYTINTPIKFSPLAIDFRKKDKQRFALRSIHNLEGYDCYENEDIWGNAVWGKTIKGGITQTIEELEKLGGVKREIQLLQYKGPERRRRLENI